jgi:glycosyltransferase involved in cell wall biosynthesis
MTDAAALPRLLILIVAYEAEATIARVLARIPADLARLCNTEILIIDDASRDGTFAAAQAVRAAGSLPFPLRVLANGRNQGYGGNQKIGYQYALQNGFDIVALIHGDGQYAPELLPTMLQPLLDGSADAVMGSRMLIRGGALKGGMPLYKFIGNRVLTFMQNRLLGARLSEFHSGYRLYRTDSLRRIPFDLNSNGFHFDTEIIVQLLRAQQRVRELPIPTFYGDEISRVNGLAYAWQVTLISLRARVQDYVLFYDRKFDCRPEDDSEPLRLSYASPHRIALDRIGPGARVLIIDKALGLSAELSRRGCNVTGIARESPAGAVLGKFYRHDIESGPLPVSFEEFDFVLLLDVIEHLRAPEQFVDHLRRACRFAPETTLLVSSANIGFFITRSMLFIGQFNYSKRGILDLTHTRLFTFGTLARLFQQGGFEVRERLGAPAPYAAALGEGALAGFLLAANRLLLRPLRSWFAYQIVLVLKPRLSLEHLLRLAEQESVARRETGMPR